MKNSLLRLRDVCILGVCLLAVNSLAYAEKNEQVASCYAIETGKFKDILNRHFNQAGYLTDESVYQTGNTKAEDLAQFSYRQAGKTSAVLITLNVVIRNQAKQLQIKQRQLKVSQTMEFGKYDSKQKENVLDFYELHSQRMEQLYASLPEVFKAYKVPCS